MGLGTWGPPQLTGTWPRNAQGLGPKLLTYGRAPARMLKPSALISTLLAGASLGSLRVVQRGTFQGRSVPQSPVKPQGLGLIP